MVDNHSPSVRSNNPKPEELVRKYLFSRNLRYRKNDKCYPGKPDMVFPKYRTLVFVNGCFWHAMRVVLGSLCRSQGLIIGNQNLNKINSVMLNT